MRCGCDPARGRRLEYYGGSPDGLWPSATPETDATAIDSQHRWGDDANTMPRLIRRTRAATPDRATGRLGRARERGQSLVEFAIVLTPLTLLLMGIVQLGLVFNAYITVSNATREAARVASVYVYDRTLTKAQNDAARLTIDAQHPHAAPWACSRRPRPSWSRTTRRSTYSLPTGVVDSDPRTGQYAKVHGRYHLDLIIPLIADLLPLENGRLALDAEVTVVIN